MVEELHIASDKKKIGFYAGLLVRGRTLDQTENLLLIVNLWFRVAYLHCLSFVLSGTGAVFRVSSQTSIQSM